MSVQPNLPANKAPVNAGQIGCSEPFAKPYEVIDAGAESLGGTVNDIGEKSGFTSDTGSYIVKKGTPYGEAAKLNMMPPGMNIEDQLVADIREMPMRKLVGLDYPGDGAF